jgi:trans-2,3-dihydro-3-hydroxyanthranilate isomerase
LHVKIRFHLLDVFAETPFAGNQLCVVSETPPGVDTALMQTLAREINFSETTFVTERRADGYTVRIFTPAAELPFAGHPTLGTAYTLVAQGLAPARLVQRSAAGEVPVSVDLDARIATMTQLPPRFGEPVSFRPAVARAASLEPEDLVEGLPIMAVGTGISHLMVPVRDEATLRRAKRRGAACHAVCGAAGDCEALYLFTVLGDGRVMARMFDRWDAIGEDPATGSAAGPLGAYLARHGLAGMPGRVAVAQGELVGRPSVLRVEAAESAAGWRIEVGGGVHIVGEGHFEVPAT